MRTILLISGTIALLVGGFFIYERMQPAHVAKNAQPKLAPNLPTQQGERLNNVGPGENPWLQRYDERGVLASQYKAARWDPQKDGVHATELEAEFFMGGGKQRLRIRGETAIVIVPQSETKSDPMKKMPAQPPDRGHLQDVTITLFDPAEDTTPALTVTMNNASFDNATFRIATDAFTDESGKRVEGEDVPVKLRGRDYDFDGRGLTIRWNELDQKLQLLEIAHGERLVVKNADKLALPSGTGPAARLLLPPELEALASINPLAAAEVVKKKPAKKKPVAPVATTHVARPPTPYRATFFENVRIEQNGKQDVIAEKMDVDFIAESDQNSVTSQPSKTPKSDKKGSDSFLSASQQKKPQSATTQAADPNIYVYWTGKLHVVPIEGAVDPDLVPGKAAVSFYGSPLKLVRNGAQAECGVARYNTATSTASLAASDTVPLVTITDSRGSVVSTPSVEYTELAEGKRIAILKGASTARIPTSDATDQNSQTLAAAWSDNCRMHLLDDAQGKTNITDAKLVGDVRIEDPQLTLNSQTLDLSFTPSTQPAIAKGPATQPLDRVAAADMRNIVASGNVHCVLKESPERSRTIDAQKLTVETARSADGKVYPRIVNADGDVVAVDQDRELRAGTLTAMLVPSTRPSSQPSATSRPGDIQTGDVALETLIARDNVRMRDQKDGSYAEGSDLQVDVVDGQQRVKLFGKPFATVASGENVLSGPEIHFLPDELRADIPGGGTLKATQSGPTTRKVDVAWAGKASVNGKTNLVDVDQQIVAKSIDKDGTLNQVESQHLQLALEPMPEDKAKAKPATKASTAQAGFLENKQVKSATFSGKAHLKSELVDPAGGILRGMNVWAETVIYDKANERLEIPVPGTMLYEDHRSKAEVAANPDADVTPGSLSGGRGSTAFEWQKSCVYEDASKRATMTGAVVIVHRPDEKGGEPFRLDADEVIAEMEKKVADENAQSPPPTSQPMAQAKLKKFSANGNVRVSSTRVTFEAEQLEYDPETHLMTAKASKDNPGSVTNESHPDKVQFKELRWNTQTDQIKVTDLRGRAVR